MLASCGKSEEFLWLEPLLLQALLSVAESNPNR